MSAIFTITMKLDIHELMDPTLRKPIPTCNLKFPHKCALHGNHMEGSWTAVYGPGKSTAAEL